LEGAIMVELGLEVAEDFCGQFRPVPTASGGTIRFATLGSIIFASSGVVGGPLGPRDGRAETADT
jgi:hypothetical protein